MAVVYKLGSLELRENDKGYQLGKETFSMSISGDSLVVLVGLAPHAIRFLQHYALSIGKSELIANRKVYPAKDCVGHVLCFSENKVPFLPATQDMEQASVIVGKGELLRKPCPNLLLFVLEDELPTDVDVHNRSVRIVKESDLEKIHSYVSW
jgi:hypothetical protein